MTRGKRGAAGGSPAAGSAPRVLRLALWAYPRRLRVRDGEVLLALAAELVAAGVPASREAAGLVRGGLAARLDVGGEAWQEVAGRLALPLASALLAVVVAGATRGGIAWPGWSWAAMLAAAGLAVGGAAFGRRAATAAGAALLCALLALDGYRDLYGAGARWVAPVRDGYVDVLPMWLPAALLLLACSAALAPARSGGTRLAWALVPALSAPLVPESASVQGALALAALAYAYGALRRDPAAVLAAATAAPAAVWLSGAFVPLDNWGLAYLTAGGLVAAALVLKAISRSAARPRRP
jgi:hypothetical protein